MNFEVFLPRQVSMPEQNAQPTIQFSLCYRKQAIHPKRAMNFFYEDVLKEICSILEWCVHREKDDVCLP